MAGILLQIRLLMFKTVFMIRALNLYGARGCTRLISKCENRVPRPLPSNSLLQLSSHTCIAIREYAGGEAVLLLTAS
jgi:hypothetical protein